MANYGSHTAQYSTEHTNAEQAAVFCENEKFSLIIGCSASARDLRCRKFSVFAKHIFISLLLRSHKWMCVVGRRRRWRIHYNFCQSCFIVFGQSSRRTSAMELEIARHPHHPPRKVNATRLPKDAKRRDITLMMMHRDVFGQTTNIVWMKAAWQQWQRRKRGARGSLGKCLSFAYKSNEWRTHAHRIQLIPSPSPQTTATF